MKKTIINLFCIITLVFSATVRAKITTIKFATEATYPPFEHVTADGKIKGFDIAVMHALCKTIGASCTISNQPFDSLIPSLQLGKFDAIIGALAITEVRAKQVAFTNPYYQDSVSFVKAKSTKLVISLADLKGKAIGVQGGTTFEHYLEDTYGDIVNIKLYASNEQALLDLESGRLDAFLGDTPFVMQWLKKGNAKNYAIVGKPITDQKYFGKGDGIAVKKDNKELLTALNKALAKIKANGVLPKLVKQYLGVNS